MTALRSLARLVALSWLSVAGFTVVACDDARPNGEPCLEDRDCESGYCRSSTCAAPPVDTPETVSSGVGAAAGGALTGGVTGQGGGAGGSGGSPRDGGGATPGGGGAGGV